jgi:hypothetical protein
MTAECQQGLLPDDAADVRGEYPVGATLHVGIFPPVVTRLI